MPAVSCLDSFKLSERLYSVGEPRMMKNVGGYDRIARLVVGPVLLAWGVAALLGYLTFGLAGTTLLVVAGLAVVLGGVFVVTGYAQKCPLNSALGVNTYRGREATVADDPTAEKPRTS
jgi:hypothetical protein